MEFIEIKYKEIPYVEFTDLNENKKHLESLSPLSWIKMEYNKNTSWEIDSETMCRMSRSRECVH